MTLSPGWVPLSGTRRLLFIIWPFIAIVVLLVVLANESIAILSAGRAFVEGESLWSKAQKQSLVHLMVPQQPLIHGPPSMLSLIC